MPVSLTLKGFLSIVSLPRRENSKRQKCHHNWSKIALYESKHAPIALNTSFLIVAIDEFLPRISN